MFLKVSTLFLGRRAVVRSKQYSFRYLHYVQGQEPEPKIREYFYFIDHQGQLFLDDARIKNFTSCFKEKDFLVFFFKRLRLNESDRYADEFPYLSPCGRERNFIRCDDKPIVYTHLIESDSGETLLSFGGAGNAMTTEFLPSRICMLPNTGRVYHPAPAKVGGIGLIKSSLAIELSKYFEFENGEDNPPTLFTWKGEKLRLTYDLIDLMDKSPLEIRELLSNKN